MKFRNHKILFLIIVGTIFMFLLTLTKTRASNTGPVTLTTDVQEVIALALYDNSYDFGNLTPNISKKGPAGFAAGVTTNANNGYNLSIKDDIPGNGSCLLHTDTVTRIIDFPATVAAPEIWSDGASYGLGLTLFAADTGKEAKWGTGTTYNDIFNKYAGVPQNTAIFHTSSGYKTNEDQSHISFALNVNSDQKTGVYSGEMTLSATANL
ncbi:MAG: hypothetical protein M1429_00500 [Patescibacteria group bacterium]|nr:hypothetical protein [Patescibacteria group bacterium]